MNAVTSMTIEGSIPIAVMFFCAMFGAINLICFILAALWEGGRAIFRLLRRQMREEPSALDRWKQPCRTEAACVHTDIGNGRFPKIKLK